MCKTKYLSALELVRCQAHRFLLRTATLLGFSRSTISCVYQEWSTIQRSSSQLDTTMGSIGFNTGQHPCGTLSSLCHDELRLFWGQQGRVQLNIRNVLLMVGIHCIYGMQPWSRTLSHPTTHNPLLCTELNCDFQVQGWINSSVDLTLGYSSDMRLPISCDQLY
jgi:hypothetical protein